MKYQIEADAIVYGIFSGETPEEALEALARDAGYASAADIPCGIDEFKVFIFEEEA